MPSFRKTLLFSSGTLLSRFTGLLREMVLSRTFGAGALLDAFYVAYRIPNLFRDMLAEGALGSSFTKNYAASHARHHQSAQALLMSMLTLTLALTSVLAALGILLHQHIVFLFTSHTPSSHTLFLHTAEHLTAILFPFMVLTSLSSIISGVWYQRNRFFYSSLSPVMLNAGCILGVLLLGPVITHHPQLFTTLFPPTVSLDPYILALALGVLIGGCAQILWLSLPILRTLTAPATISWKHPGVLQTCKESLPMMLAAGVAQFQILIGTNFATSLESGAPSWLHLSFRLIQLPIGLFAVAIATVILPTLAVSFKTSTSPPHTLSQSLQWALWLLLPCTIITLFGASQIVRLLFLGGAFDPYDLHMTQNALKAYGWGLLGYGLSKVLISYYYAKERTSYVLKVAVLCLVVYALCGGFLLSSFQHLAIAGSAAATLSLQAIMLIYGARKDIWASEQHPHSSHSLTTTVILISICSALTAGLLWCTQTLIPLTLPSTPEITPTNLHTIRWHALRDLAIFSTLTTITFGSTYLLCRKIRKPISL